MYYYTLLFAILLIVTPSHIQAEIENTQTFNINDCYSQLMFAYAAYCPTSAISGWSCWFCVSQNASDTSGFVWRGSVSNDAAGLYVYYGNRPSTSTLEVVFRGSANIQNWISNIDFVQTTYSHAGAPSGLKVHQGFYTDYSILQPALTTAILHVFSTVSGITKVKFVGHSLGGALATFAALEIGPQLPAGVTYAAYTFGSPRVGNSAFVNYYQSVVPSTFRITNKNDIVPHILTTLAGFSHVTQEVWWSSSTKYKICSATIGEDGSCSDSVFLPTSTSDHTNYLNIQLGQGGC